jgi:hypothetical protein
LVGLVVDTIANRELDTLVHLGERRIRTREPAPPPEKAPPKPMMPAKPKREVLPESARRFRAWLEGKGN